MPDQSIQNDSFFNEARAADPETMIVFAEMYYRGDGVEKSYEKAAALYRLAANQDIPQAQYELGMLYDQGLGVEKNAIEAFSWIEKAANHDFPAARLYINEH